MKMRIAQRSVRGKTDACAASVSAGGAICFVAVVNGIYFDLDFDVGLVLPDVELGFLAGTRFFLGFGAGAAPKDAGAGAGSTERMPKARGPGDSSQTMTCSFNNCFASSGLLASMRRVVSSANQRAVVWARAFSKSVACSGSGAD